MLKDYGELFRKDPVLSKNAAEFAGLARDISEVFTDLRPLKPVGLANLRVAYHGACSLQHGQKIHDVPINETDQQRISLSFNTYFRGEIGSKKQLTQVVLK